MQPALFSTRTRTSLDNFSLVDGIVATVYYSTGGVLGVLGMLRACRGQKFLLPI